MKTINLKKIIEDQLLDKNEIAKLLFPTNAYPVLALNRILAGTAVLNADQISKFSLFSSIPIAELYEGNGWKSTIKKNVHILTSGDYVAELDTSTWTTKIFHNESLFHEFVMVSKSITLSDYIAKLNEVIKTNL